MALVFDVYRVFKMTRGMKDEKIERKERVGREDAGWLGGDV